MLTCLLLGLYLSPAPQGPERTVDFVSLRPLLAHRDPLSSMPFGTLLTTEGALDLLPGAQEPDPGLDADQVVALLGSLQHQATEGGKLDLQMHGDQLFVAGEREPVSATVR